MSQRPPCFGMAYHMGGGHRDREMQAFQTRDRGAAQFMTAALIGLGYDYTDDFVNYPWPDDVPPPQRAEEFIPVDLSHVPENGLIYQTTRPPMHDSIVGDRRHIKRSFTVLEERLMQEVLADYFQFCARSQISLTSACGAISPEIAKRRSICFRQNLGAMYQSYGDPDTRSWRHFKKGAESRTAAFLVYREHAWPGGPGFLAAFGVGGLETLVWCRQLSTRFRHLLGTTSFVMAELRPPERLDRPLCTDFADQYEVTILGAAPLVPGPANGSRKGGSSIASRGDVTAPPHL